MNKKTGLFSEIHQLKGAQAAKAKSKEADKRNLQEIQELVGEIRPEDGLDPRYEAKRQRRIGDQSRLGIAHDIHKQEQFNGQIHSAIDDALLCATNPVLNGLMVREVVKQKSVYMVVVEPRDPAQTFDLGAATTALEQAVPMLRREVAASITRKETPQLRFTVLPAGTEKIAL